MTIITVDENGQQFVTPDELDEFEYYRDNIFVRTYNELLAINPIEIDAGFLGWVNVSGPTYWESNDEAKVYWNGVAWEALQAVNVQLNAIGNWPDNFPRPLYSKGVGTPTNRSFNFASSTNLFTSGYRDESILCADGEYEGTLARINWFAQVGDTLSEIWVADQGILEISAGGYSSEDPYPSLVSGTIIDIDSNGYLHLIQKSNGDYWTNVIGSWVKTTAPPNQSPYLKGGFDSNDIFHIFHESGNQLKHSYKPAASGSWSTEDIGTYNPAAYSNVFMDFYIDESDGLHIVTSDVGGFTYFYKADGGSWAENTPDTLGTLTGYSYLGICATDDRIDIVYGNGYDDTIRVVTYESGSWNTPVLIRTYSFLNDVDIHLDSSENFYIVSFELVGEEETRIWKDTGSGYSLEHTIIHDTDFTANQYSKSAMSLDDSLYILYPAVPNTPACSYYPYANLLYKVTDVVAPWELLNNIGGYIAGPFSRLPRNPVIIFATEIEFDEYYTKIYKI